MVYNNKKQMRVKRKVSILMDNKENQQKNNYSKEEMARTIARNMSSHSFSDNSDIRNTLSDKDFKEKKPLSKTKIILLSVGAVALAALLTFYFYGMAKTKDKFLPETYINGGNVGAMTVEEVTEFFQKKQAEKVPKNITIVKADGTSASIPGDKIGYNDNIAKSVESFFESQNHYFWFTSLLSKEEFELKVEYSYDLDKLDGEVQRRVVDTSLDDGSEDAYIEKSDKKFVIVEEIQGTKIDSSKQTELLEYIKEQISQGNTRVDISELDFYEKPEVVAEDLQETCDKLNAIVDITIAYDFDYTTETLEGETIIDWITVNKRSKVPYTVDSDKVMEYVEQLAGKYDTYKKDRTFKSTSRGTILVKQGKGCYGWWIDQQKTCDALIEAIEAGENASLEPVYYVNPNSNYKYTCNEDWRTEKTDIGNTYIEVDLKKQHLWYYENGKLKFETDIVSGKPTEERNTPEGVYKLWLKEKDKTLTGSNSTESWETPVKYWNNISTIGVGLHDATWHSSFGGDRYKNYGSHGCINMPLEAAKYVYENIEIGTPCVMYW